MRGCCLCGRTFVAGSSESLFTCHTLNNLRLRNPIQVKNNKIEEPVFHLPRLTEQDLRDYLHWQEQYKNSLERRTAHTMNFASQQEPAIVLQNNIPPAPNNKLKSDDIIQSEESTGSDTESSLSAIYNNELFWIAPQKQCRQDL